MYNPSTGRWLSEDPIADDPALYRYEGKEERPKYASTPLGPGESGLYSYERRVLGLTHPDDAKPERGWMFSRMAEEANLYVYARNDPVNRSDPSGLDSIGFIHNEDNEFPAVVWKFGCGHQRLYVGRVEEPGVVVLAPSFCKAAGLEGEICDRGKVSQKELADAAQSIKGDCGPRELHVAIVGNIVKNLYAENPDPPPDPTQGTPAEVDFANIPKSRVDEVLANKAENGAEAFERDGEQVVVAPMIFDGQVKNAVFVRNRTEHTRTEYCDTGGRIEVNYRTDVEFHDTYRIVGFGPGGTNHDKETLAEVRFFDNKELAKLYGRAEMLTFALHLVPFGTASDAVSGGDVPTWELVLATAGDLAFAGGLVAKTSLAAGKAPLIGARTGTYVARGAVVLDATAIGGQTVQAGIQVVNDPNAANIAIAAAGVTAIIFGVSYSRRRAKANADLDLDAPSNRRPDGPDGPVPKPNLHQPAQEATTELAEEIRNAGSKRASDQTVTLIETQEGSLIAAGGKTDLTDAQKEFCRERGILVAENLPEVHAELTAIAEAGRIGEIPRRGVVSSRMCNRGELNCLEQITGWLKDSGYEMKLSSDRLTFEFVKIND